MKLRPRILNQPTKRTNLAIMSVCGLFSGLVFSAGMPGLILIPLLSVTVYILISDTEQTLRQSLLLIISYSVPFNLTVLSWFLEADLAGLVGVNSYILVLASFGCLLLVTTVNTLAMLALGYAAFRTRKIYKNKYWWRLTILACTWVLFEWLRSVAFSVVWYSREASIGDYWNFGSIGLGALDSPFAPLATVVGMYGLTFMFIFIAGIAAYNIRHAQWLKLLTLFALTILGLFVSNKMLVSQIAASKEGTVMQMETAGVSPVAIIPIDQQRSAKKDLILLPEYSYLFGDTQGNLAETYINERLDAHGISISVSDGGSLERFGTLEFRDSESKVLDTHTKELLIPAGEYMPFVLRTVFVLIGQSHLTQTFDDTRSVQKGLPPKVFKSPGIDIGPVACSGILGRGIYRNLANNGADVLTNSASIITFNNSAAYARQSILMGRFHAVANQRVFAQSTKGGPAFVVNPDGQFLVAPSKSDNVKTKFIDFSFATNSRKTLYTQAGDWPLLASGLLIAALIGKYQLLPLYKRLGKS